VSAAERQKEIDCSQKKAGLFPLSPKAGGVGINLTEADYIVILYPW
jgi:SNF2 family DNA or RNA helicase